MREPIPSIREENPSIPQSIENIIKRATAKNPKNRYDSAREMHDDLLTALDDDRMDEEVYQYKYPENESESKKKVKPQKEETKEEFLDEEEPKNVEKTKDTDENVEDDAEESADDKAFKKNKKIIIILAAIFGAIVLILLFIFFILPMFGGNKSVKVPDCEGLKVSQCEAKLEKVGLVANSDIKTKASDKIKKNRVIKTSPAKDKKVKKGTEVTITKSSGDESVELEDYTGLNSIEVKTLLETKYGLNVTIEKREVSDKSKKYEEDIIIGQSLAAGSKVKEGDTLVLYVPDDAELFVDMASEGWTKDDVQALCDEYGLSCTLEPVETNAYAEDKIISQSRRVGSTISRGSSLTVKYAVKPTKKPAASSSPSTTPSSGTTTSPSSSPDDTENQ